MEEKTKLNTVLEKKDVYIVNWKSEIEHPLEMVTTGGFIQIQKGYNCIYLEKKEQGIAVINTLREFYKNVNCQMYVTKKALTVLPIYQSIMDEYFEEMKYLYPTDGVFPEKVNAGRTRVNHLKISIGANLQI